ncbi:MAG: B12-binding domain-containing radical SAM protein [Coriobacteriales bacterium]|jgi:radical SAM superfamily enzyme YgiQ (UPF0313 family)|nr:B12-binding domain-containing radical SAM protein [Coriobacteriales bacterium]
MAAIALIRPLYEGDESEFQEPLGIERLAGFLESHGVVACQFDRRLYEQERRVGWNGRDAQGAGAVVEAQSAGTDAEVQSAGAATKAQSVGAVDTTCSSFWDDFAAAFPADAPPALVGLSVMTAEDIPDALRVISRLRASYPKTRFVAGGLFVTTNPEAASRRFPSDVRLIVGEGECGLLALCADAPNTRVRADVNGIGIDANTSASAEALGPNGWAQASRPNLERYLNCGCAINIQSSRGCKGRCTFCATPEMPAPYHRWQERSLDLVVDEIEQLVERVEAAGLAPIFNFVDDDFGPLERIEEFNDELARRGLRIAYALQMRVSALLSKPSSEQLAKRFAALKQGGLTRVFLGVESLDDETLRAWNKPYRTDGLAPVFAALRDAGISAHVGYILWHGQSSVEGARDEARRLWEMGLYSPKVAESRMVVFPGSRLYRQLLTDDPQTRRARWEPLAPEAERFYQQLSRRLEPLYQVWKEGAVLAPWLAAWAHLDGKRQLADELDEVLEQCASYSYQALVEDGVCAGIAGIAGELRECVERIRRQALGAQDAARQRPRRVREPQEPQEARELQGAREPREALP